MEEAVIERKAGEAGGSRIPVFAALLFIFAGSALAYVGPGAGFGIVTSFLVFLNAIVVSLLSALIWPVTLFIRMLRRRRREYRASARRVVILGMDGLSPEITENLMEQGRMPAFAALRKSGTFARLGTTCPGISPVAWSSFQTGVDPGGHGIFDFLAPDRDRYLATLSSVKTGTATVTRRLGPFRRKVEKPYIRLLRKSRPFWSIFRKYGLGSTVLRVPITYPPEPLDGHLLSGMCVPDLRGTQGSYTVLRPGKPDGSITGGLQRELKKEDDGSWTGTIPGPAGEDGRQLTLPLTLEKKRGSFRLKSPDGELQLEPGVLSRWLEMKFDPGGAKGIARFCLTFHEGEPVLYCTAINVDPFSPSVPVSHPVHYSRYLAGIQGPFATLGLAEDTWALSNGAVTDEVFLQQAWSIYDERKKMFFDALKRRRSGFVSCVFDTSDRIQHMFWDRGTAPGTPIGDMYEEMDRLLAETLEKLGSSDMLIVMSDHGFTSFHTCIDFNRWLVDNGYMVLEDGVETVETSFEGVDWSRTRAWSMGLAGIMLNLRGRESCGIVNPGEEAEGLLREISGKLKELQNGDGESVISEVYPADEVYSGPYASMGPDLIVGTRSGFRAGWKCVTGGVGSRVIYSNDQHWNGDHCHDHVLVPGTLLCDRPLSAENASITDIAPTVLRALGIRPRPYMKGRSLLREGEEV